MGFHYIKALATDLSLLTALWVIDLKTYLDISAAFIILITVALRFVREIKEHRK